MSHTIFETSRKDMFEALNGARPDNCYLFQVCIPEGATVFRTDNGPRRVVLEGTVEVDVSEVVEIDGGVSGFIYKLGCTYFVNANDVLAIRYILKDVATRLEFS